MNKEEQKLLEQSLNYILKEEMEKIKNSVKEYILKDSSKGISQMIGRRYGHMWQKLVIQTFNHSKEINVGERILYKDYVEAWLRHNLNDEMNKCCRKSSREIVRKFLDENTGTDQQDLCDYTFYKSEEKVYAVDTKFRFISNDSNTVREIADSARHLKFMGYKPVLLIRRKKSESISSPIKRFEKQGWILKCGQDASDFILKKTGFDLGEWIDVNIRVWDELKEYQNELIKLRFGKENWEY
nr:hypothetical protein [Clostridium chromiireducens]